jgi:AcrR family transcriptional regulator
MARSRDEHKRVAILQAAKMLFSRNGFRGTSISDIVKETGMTVGTIYTYFKSKQEIIRVIVEEGWREIYGRIEKDFAAAREPGERMKILIRRIIPGILTDVDFVNILLTEAAASTRLEEKVEQLTDLVFPLVRPLVGRRPSFSRDTLRTALVVIFLGIMSTVRVARTGLLGIDERDVVAFVTTLARESLGVAL